MLCAGQAVVSKIGLPGTKCAEPLSSYCFGDNKRKPLCVIGFTDI